MKHTLTALQFCKNISLYTYLCLNMSIFQLIMYTNKNKTTIIYYMASYTYAPKGKQTLSDFNIFLQLIINVKGLTVSKAIIC